MSETLQHLVLVRHFESEGDARRGAWRRGEPFKTDKLPEEEGLTPHGYIEGPYSGEFVREEVIGKLALHHFDYYFVSSVLRAEQSAGVMDLPDALWQEDPRLNERNRGLVRGLRKEQHKQRYPESYEQMVSDPLHWTPPGGNSILDVAELQTDFLEDIKYIARSAIVVGHRDSMWASMMPLEGLNEAELAAVNTDDIHNGQIWHYTSIHPETGWQAPQLMWKRSIDPIHPETDTGWQTLPNVVRQYAKIA